MRKPSQVIQQSLGPAGRREKIAKSTLHLIKVCWIMTGAALAGCVGEMTSASDAPSFGERDQQVAFKNGGIVQGILVMGPEVRTFKPCAENTELWAVPVKSILDAYGALASEPYQPVFLEVDSEYDEAPRSGSGASYPGQIRLVNLLRAEPVGEGLGCEDSLLGVAYKASGHDPFWHVRVLSDQITLATPEIPSTIFSEAPPIPMDNGWRFEAESDGPEAIRLRLDLIRASCVDSVSGSLYTWTASLDVGGVIRFGCAWEGDLALDRGTGSASLRIAS